MTDRTKYRMLEMIPGTMIWLTFTASIVLSFVAPITMIYFILLFDLYWFVRIVYMVCYMILAYVRFRRTSRLNWRSRAQALPGFEKIHHVIFLPTFKEPLSVIRTTFEALVQSNYPTEKMIVVLCGEERDAQVVREHARVIQKEYGHRFQKLLFTLHPDGIPGEVAGKGSNLHFAGWRFKEYIDTELKIPYEHILVSSFDIDTNVHPEYFGYLTATFLSTPNRLHASYQPIPFFHNNIWEAPAIMRVAALGTTFWLMSEQLRPERLFTFSSHSMPFQALVDVGFWQNDIVTEDSRIFLQCLLHYDGDYRVVPLYLPVSMDAVVGDTWVQSLKNLYRQQRRWAWGTEHFPYLLWHYPDHPRLSFRRKFHYSFTLAEGMFSWATAPILITLLGRLPLALVDEQEKISVVVQNVPQLLEVLMNYALVGLIVTGVLSFTILPRRPHTRWYQWIPMALQWILTPISMVFFGSLPAIEAQTRLMFGKYLGFFVTPKRR
ncbi:MAG: glycosyltransferase family 2 protein [Candidatus Kerfeldbacteria bacterium]|nr:glycosyltransferase family 2 protein [Candidatus Kerfeldbacteria bacterium]